MFVIRQVKSDNLDLKQPIKLYIRAVDNQSCFRAFCYSHDYNIIMDGFSNQFYLLISLIHSLNFMKYA